MDIKTHLINEATLWCEQTGNSLSTLGNYALKDGGFFKRLEEGGGFTLATYDKIMNWLQEQKTTLDR